MARSIATVRILIVKYLGISFLKETVNEGDDLRIVRVNADGSRDDLGDVRLMDELCEKDEREPWQGDE